MQAKPKNPKFANRRPRWNVRIDGSMYYRSIIVWALHYGEWPPDDREVDHKSRDTLDDRISNLRLATRSQNIANTTIPATNTSGYKGVSWHAQTSKWGARISFRGRSKSLGLFDDPREAHEAYMEAARSLQGEYASDGIA